MPQRPTPPPAPDPDDPEALLDEALEESFPASDPPAMTEPAPARNNPR
jgi:hypothetical protein